MEAVLNDNNIQISTGAEFSISFVSPSKGIQDVKIIESEPNKFMALFEEDNVDFILKVNNHGSNGTSRGLAFKVKTLGAEKSFYIGPCGFAIFETLESNGGKFHFVSQNSSAGEQLVGLTAKEFKMSHQEASLKISRMELEFKAEKLKEKKLSLPRPIKHLKLEPIRPIEIPSDGKSIFVHIRTLKLQVINIKVRFEDTIENLKALIPDDAGDIPPDQRGLLFRGKQLEDGLTVADYRIRHQDVLLLVFRISQESIPLIPIPSDGKSIFVHIKSLTGKILNIKIRFEDTIENLKALIQDAEGIPPDQQRLVREGIDFEDGMTVAHYEMRHQDVIYLVLRLRGGGGGPMAQSLPSAAVQNARPLPDSVARGAICFGEKSDQVFDSYKFFVSDTSIVIPPVTIEFQLKQN